MKKRLLALAAALALVLTACGAPAGPAPVEDDALHILATTYPVYLFTTAVTEGVEGVQVDLLVNSQSSCLHDYTLTVGDMKAIEGADVIVMNGAGLEDFMADALSRSDAAVIDCSEGVELLPSLEGDGDDPHIWMDPYRAAQMVENISAGLAAVDGENAQRYQEQAFDLTFLMTNWADTLRDVIASDQPDLQLPHRELITFHNGFQYFAEAFDLDLLKAIEEEEGAEASAADIKEIVTLINEYQIPAIFTEKNGSDSTAQAIARETGVEVCVLDMIMSGSGTGLGPYDDAISENVKTIINALSEGRVRAQ